MGIGSTGKSVILVVEDLAGLRELVAEFLIGEGYCVIATGNPMEALAALRDTRRIDLLFTDILLPEENGLRLAREAIMLRPELRVLYTTGYALPVLDKEPMVCRGEILPKPFHLRALAEKIAWTLRARRFEMNAVLRELWRVWSATRVRMPATTKDPPAGLSSILKHVAVSTVVDPLPRLRLKYVYFGEALVRWAGRDPAGMYIDEIASGEYREFIMGVYANVVGNRRGVYAASAFRGEQPALTERLLLPITDRDGSVAGVLAAQTFDAVDPATTAFPVVQRAPERVDIVEAMH